MSTEDLWALFRKYEARSSSAPTAEISLAAATMVNAIAKILAGRCEND